MKKMGKVASAVMTVAILWGFAACSSDDSSSSGPDVTPGTIGQANPTLLAAAEASKSMGNDAVLFYYRPDENYSSWGVWAWTQGTSESGENGYNATKGKVATTTVNGKKIAYWNMSSLTSSVESLQKIITDKTQMGFIIRDDNWVKDPGIDQIMDFSLGTKFMVLSGDSAVYTLSDNIGPSIAGAVSTSATAIKVSLSVSLGLETTAGSSGFVLKDGDGAEVSIVDSVNAEYPDNRNRNEARTVILTTASKLDASKTYYVSHESFSPAAGYEVGMVGAAKDLPVYSDDDLGVTLSGTKATFKTWAPTASDVKLLVYATASDVGTFNAKSVAAKAVGSTTDTELYGTPATDPITMTKDAETGVWSCEIGDASAYKYYKYQIVNGGTTYYVSDIWGKSVSADAIASQITDINKDASAIPSGYTKDTAYGTKDAYYNPFGETGKTKKTYSDAIVYEMHITDWSYAEDATATANVGKYLTIANGTKVIEHVKAMGVTHVQILPVFEFAETNANDKYNWGYNPYHYNVPEGRYVTVDYEDGTQAVCELRALIAAFHEAGIAVNMDVVYNHTNGTQGGSLYDSTVPYYFYRFTDDGEYSNGSGCGNEVDSEAPMAKKYIIDSLKHWMLDYHFNGFRFDLMGCLSKETMADIYAALYEIDPNVMVYGEPWTGGTAAVTNGASQAVSSSVGYGAGAFDDDFRDAIKGAEFGGFKQGQVQGTFNDSAITTGLAGNSGNNKRNETGVLGLSLHYVECHDNYTLFDKLAISYWQRAKDKTTTTTGDLFSKIGEAGLTEVRAEDKLAGAFVLLSQGTAFLNGGQEFLRTKRGNENSYATSNTASTSTNGIDLTFAETYSDVCNTYKGLIALRKANPAAFGGNASATATTEAKGVTKYTTGDFLVYFNATDAAVSITTSGYAKAVDVSSGTPSESTTLPATVAAKSFVILKK